MFNVGGGELLVIILVALIVLGPQRLPGAIRQAGQWLGELRKISSGFQTDLSSALAEAERDADRERADKARREKGESPTPSAAAPMLPVTPTPAPPTSTDTPPDAVTDDASERSSGAARPVESPDPAAGEAAATDATLPDDDATST